MVIEFKIQEIQQNINSHSHGYGQFVIPFNGSVFIDMDDQPYIFDEKSLGYIPPGKNHRYSSDSGGKALVVNINDKIIKDQDRYTLETAGPFILDGKLISIINIIKDEVETGGPKDSIKYLFFYVYDKIVATRTYKSVTYIHDNYQYDIPMKTLADLEHYSTNYFTDWFKKHLGMSPVSYIKRVRMEEAKTLLLTTGYNLTQIAMQTGYSQSSTMCKIFKELEGCTPKEFRRQNY